MMSLLTMLAASPAAIPSDWRAGLPQPLLPSQPGWVEFYYDAWRIADQQAQRVPLGWHFSNAFNPDVIYQWDEVWISTFAKYVQGAHPNVTNQPTYNPMLTSYANGLPHPMIGYVNPLYHQYP